MTGRKRLLEVVKLVLGVETWNHRFTTIVQLFLKSTPIGITQTAKLGADIHHFGLYSKTHVSIHLSDKKTQ